VLAGMAAAQQAVRELIAWPRLYSSQAAALGVQWPHGLLLHGPPGCGKSLLVRTVAGMVLLPVNPLGVLCQLCHAACSV
jgi:ATP-dependent 26S proteasome regulatory subunit